MINIPAKGEKAIKHKCPICGVELPAHNVTIHLRNKHPENQKYFYDKQQKKISTRPNDDLPEDPIASPPTPPPVITPPPPTLVPSSVAPPKVHKTKPQVPPTAIKPTEKEREENVDDDGYRGLFT